MRTSSYEEPPNLCVCVCVCVCGGYFFKTESRLVRSVRVFYKSLGVRNGYLGCPVLRCVGLRKEASSYVDFENSKDRKNGGNGRHRSLKINRRYIHVRLHACFHCLGPAPRSFRVGVVL